MKINHTSGFTLIEVLVSMVILSIGVLGLGMLQLMAVRNTQSGYFHSQATILASDAIESMRANIPAVNGNNYQISFADATPARVDCFGVIANCTTAEIAAADLNQWRVMLNNFLPSGNGQINTVEAAGITQVTVAVQWVDPNTAQNGAEQLTFVAELPR